MALPHGPRTILSFAVAVNRLFCAGASRLAPVLDKSNSLVYQGLSAAAHVYLRALTRRPLDAKRGGIHGTNTRAWHHSLSRPLDPGEFDPPYQNVSGGPRPAGALACDR